LRAKRLPFRAKRDGHLVAKESPTFSDPKKALLGDGFQQRDGLHLADKALAALHSLTAVSGQVHLAGG
jgi:hypothetical protein